MNKSRDLGFPHGLARLQELVQRPFGQTNLVIYIEFLLGLWSVRTKKSPPIGGLGKGLGVGLWLLIEGVQVHFQGFGHVSNQTGERAFFRIVQTHFFFLFEKCLVECSSFLMGTLN